MSANVPIIISLNLSSGYYLSVIVLFRTVNTQTPILSFFSFFMEYISLSIIPIKIPDSIRIELSNGFPKIKFIAMVINNDKRKIIVYSNNIFLYFCIIRCLRFNNGITHTFKMKVCVIHFFMKDQLKVNVSTV